jgi:murein DD-endopeptidase MepM/ murein hydrolase activator NlpD
MAPRKKPKIVYIDDTGPELTPPVAEVRLPKPQPQEKKKEAPQSPKSRTIPTSPHPQEPTAEPMVEQMPRSSKMPRFSILAGIILGFIALSVLAAFIFIPVKKPKPEAEVPLETKVLENCLHIHPDIDWGHDLSTLECQAGAMEDGENLADLLLKRNVDYKQVIQLMENVASKGLPNLSPGNPYSLLYQPKNLQTPVIMAYQPSSSQFVLMNLQGPPLVHLHKREVEQHGPKQLNVIIQSTLADAMYNRNSGLLLTRELEAAIKYKVDLFYLNPGDRITMLYDEIVYEGDFTEVGDLLAVTYSQDGREGYAVYFQDSTHNGFYDELGRPMKSGFLMAPLEYYRISSPYDVNRVDPVTRSGQIRPHLGTDYAAPEGTPILSVGDGIVINAENRGNNGNYVKIMHNEEIQTQYLHMSAFAEGIEPGVEVHQGQVIGYVGSTGRTTGPHVCFRYWKNGLQVDHRKEPNFGTSVGLLGGTLAKFQARRDSLLGMMTEL